MNLVIDEGNTRTKVAWFEGNRLKDVQTYSVPFQEITLDHFELEKCINCIISSVKNPKSAYIDFLNRFASGLYLDSQTPIPIQNCYQTKATLGNDRIAAAVGAWEQFKGKNILIIDAGTAITYEYLTEKGDYLGGAISPGMSLRFEVLNKSTSNLPKVVPQRAIQIVGKTTESAIQSGVINGILHEIDGVINNFLATNINTSVLGTGGDINFFDKNLKNSIFVLPNLVLMGLNRILLYNA